MHHSSADLLKKKKKSKKFFQEFKQKFCLARFGSKQFLLKTPLSKVTLVKWPLCQMAYSSKTKLSNEPYRHFV